jgi:peptidoglycan/xylan/chitin deacetylase (PgdA/CDA1 family)
MKASHALITIAHMDLVLRAPWTIDVPVAFSRLLGSTGTNRAGRRFGRILMFHGTPAHHSAEIERQLRYLATAFVIVPLAELLQCVAQPNRSLGRKLALTFDDGFRNNVTVLYPLLAKLGIPATFFICPSLIDRGGWLWNHDMRQRLYTLGWPARRTLAAKVGARSAAVEDLVEWMKTLDLASRLRVERRVRAATHGYAPSTIEREEHDLASWEELRTLDPRLVAIGSHTLTHPILTTLSEREAEVEICESRRLIEKRLGRACEFFCYPNGDISRFALECVRRHYRAALTVTADWVKPSCDPHLVPRFHAPRGVLRLAWNIYP